MAAPRQKENALIVVQGCISYSERNKLYSYRSGPPGFEHILRALLRPQDVFFYGAGLTTENRLFAGRHRSYREAICAKRFS